MDNAFTTRGREELPMIRALMAIDLRNNFKSVCDKVSDGEVIIITRPKGNNVVLVSENEYNRLLAGQQVRKDEP